MDLGLVYAVIDRDWADFAAQSHRLGLGVPNRVGTDIFMPLQPPGASEAFLAVLGCDDYDTIAPLLDFANPGNPAERGRAHWPKIAGAPMNSIEYEGTAMPIICTPGTRGYHLHSSHAKENWPASTWKLAKVASLLWRFTCQMGAYQGRGV
jgi:hypothetical protein